jgi:hypothetical protein
MFGPSKQHLGGSEVHNSEEAKMAFGDWMQILEPDLFWVRISKFVPSLDRSINFFSIISVPSLK